MGRNKRSRCLSGIVLLFVILTAVISAAAQRPLTPAPTASPSASPAATPSPSPSLEHDFFKNIWRDQKAIWTAPFHLERSDMKWVVPSTIGFMALVTTDRMTGDAILEHNSQVAWSRHISNLGSVYSLAAASGAFYFIGREKNNYRARETGLLGAEAMINALIVEGVLKGVTQRARPLDGHERSEFFAGGSSFPSGHSTETWALATVVAHEYKDRLAVQIAAYGIASAVSVARFTGHKHYMSDILAGSALGFGIGRYTYGAHHRESATSVSRSKWPQIVPEYSRAAHRYGAALTWNF